MALAMAFSVVVAAKRIFATIRAGVEALSAQRCLAPLPLSISGSPPKQSQWSRPAAIERSLSMTRIQAGVNGHFFDICRHCLLPTRSERHRASIAVWEEPEGDCYIFHDGERTADAGSE